MNSGSSRRRMTLRRWNAASAVITVVMACLALMIVPAHRDVLLRRLTESSQALRIGELWALVATSLCAILGSQHEDFPRFADPTVHPMASGTLLALMAVHAASSVAPGLKASNLTHRGIVSRGPYAWVRHPADTCKNLAWWIGSIPLVGQAFAAGWLDGLMAAGSVAGWTALCVLRALTEEDHLRSVDGDYAAYARRVRYRFIPGVV